jgi:hypothetical protein
MFAAEDKTVAEIGALFGITRGSVYRYVKAALGEGQFCAARGFAE